MSSTILTDMQDAVRRVMLLTSKSGVNFASQPQANRFDAILEAIVPSRRDPTSNKVLSLIKTLLDMKAIRSDEAGQMYSALLQRVSKYNSNNVQANLESLITDVRETIAQKERSANRHNLGSLVALNGFLSTQPAAVERGQDNYVAFISALRLMVTEAPQSEVYMSGPNYYFQTSRNGSQTVNLTKAFENLRNIWGVRAPVYERSPASSLLTPNTRLLLLLIAPFTDSVSMARDSYLGHLLTLYRETIGNTKVDELTFNEIREVSKAVGDSSAENLQATLNFLLTNRRSKPPEEYILTESEEKVLRYIQQSVGLYLMQDGRSPSQALDMASTNLAPSFYASNRPFINKLLDYLHRAAAMAPDYFSHIILNPHWLPPEGFFTNTYDFPEVDDGLLWDDIDSALVGSPYRDEFVIDKEPSSLRDSMLSIPTPFSAEVGYEDSVTAESPSSISRPTKDGNRERLRDKIRRWKMYPTDNDDEFVRSKRRDRSPIRGPRPEKRHAQFEDEEDDDVDAKHDENPFSHLMPRHVYKKKTYRR